MRALAIILHYGNPALAKGLAETLLRADPDAQGRVQVFDNAAPEPYAGAWRRAPENVFWAGALTACLEAAREQHCTHLWFLNNDIRLISPPPFLSRIEARLRRLEALTSKTVGLWSPAENSSPYHPQMVARCGEAMLTPLIDGIAPLFNLEAVAAVGGVDAADNLPGYGVDMWLSLRLYRAGWLTVVDPHVQIRHRRHTTAKTISGFMETAARLEDTFLRKRLGPDWRTLLEHLKQDVMPLCPASAHREKI